MATPVYLDSGTPTSREVDVTGLSYGYITSHSKYGDSTDPQYEPNLDRTVTLTGLATPQVQLDVEVMQLEGYNDNNCDDKLVITTTNPALPDICATAPPSRQYTANLNSNQMSVQFVTNAFDENNGFWMKYTGEQQFTKALSNSYSVHTILCFTINLRMKSSNFSANL